MLLKEVTFKQQEENDQMVREQFPFSLDSVNVTELTLKIFSKCSLVSDNYLKLII